MSAATPYSPTVDFSEEEADQTAGRSTVRTAALDEELNDIVLSINSLITKLSAIQRDDNALLDGVVHYWALSTDVLALIGSSGWTIRGAWLTATAYVSKDFVTNGTGTYVCLVAHTSGVFAVDYAAGKWGAVFDTAGNTASGVTFVPTGSVAAANVQAAIAEVDSEKLAKSANLADVASAAGARGSLSVLSTAEIQTASAQLAVIGGTGDAITAVCTPAIAALTNNFIVFGYASAASTSTAPTWAQDGLAAKAIKKLNKQPLSAGDIAGAGHLVQMFYSVVDDCYLLMNPAITTAVLTLPRMFISGMVQSNSVGDPVNDVDISAGAARDSTNATNILLSAITKRLDAAWAVGSGSGGLDTGAIANADYYIWAIKRSDTLVTDALFSLSSTAPTMPANYDSKRLIGWFKRVGATIVLFHTYEIEGGGLELNWDSPTLDVNLANTLTTARRTDAVKVPLNFSVTAHLNVLLFDATAPAEAWIYCPDQTDLAPATGGAPLANIVSATTRGVLQQMKVRTSAAGLIAARADLATVDSYLVVTAGFTWARRN